MQKKLIIVDISSFIFRSFYAIRPLHAPDGTPVNAVHGVLSMLLKLLSSERPSHIFLARDSGRKTFRLEIYPEYKANRSEPPEELKPQFKLIEELIEKMGIPNLSMQGYEADDVIGSAVHSFREDFEEIYIVSSDKDLMQFVDSKVKILDTMKEKVYLPDDVFEKMGVRPSQIVDYLSLLGDASDNIPGVRGIGEKGAAKLLLEYGNLEGCFKNKEKVANKKMREALENYEADAYLSRRLIEIKTDLNLEKTVEDLAYRFVPAPELLEFLRRLGLKTALKNIEDLSYGEALARENDRPLMQKKVSLSSEELSAEISFPEEQLGLELAEDGVLGIAGSKNYLVQDRDLAKKLLLTLLGDKTKTLIAYNAKALYRFALAEGVKVEARLEDTLLLHYLLDASWTQKLADILERYEGQSSENPAERAFLIKGLCEKLKKEVAEKNLLSIYEEMDRPFISVLAKMEHEGILINPPFFAELDHEFSKILNHTDEEICAVAGTTLNLKSPKQVGELLFEKLQLPVIKKTKTGYSTDAEVLEELNSLGLSPIPGLILKYRELEKLQSTYVQVLPTLVNAHSRRIHTTFNQTGTHTGRLSSEKPNLQNIPVRTENGRRIRKGFIAAPGKLLLSADYSQIELRLLAHFSEDPIMLSAFLKGEDIHAQTAAEITEKNLSEVTREERSMAKTVNFGLMYGQSSFGLSATLGIGRNEAKNYIIRYFEKFSRVKAFLDGLKEKAEVKGYTETLHGRKRFLPDIRSQNRNIKSQAERMAINTPIQGTASDIIKLAMLSLDRELRERALSSKLLLQVHDELIFEVPENEVELMKELVRERMENIVRLKVPLTVNLGIGINWYDLK